MDGSLTEMTRWLLANFGPSGVMIAALGGLVIYLWREQARLAERRIEELRKTLEAMNSSSAAIAALTISVDSRNSTLSELLRAVTALGHGADINRQRFGELGDRLEKRQEEALSTLRDIQSRGRAR